MQLEIRGLKKSYGKQQALVGVNLQLSKGVYALLGPNGAGKSTFMNILTGNLKADQGEIYYGGQKVERRQKEFRSILGYMPQQQGIYDNFTVLRFLFYMAALKGMKKEEADKEIKKILQRVNLVKERDKYLGELSGGMKQRVLIAQAILNEPELVILDEPTAGLDPKERIRVRNLISEIAMNKIVIFATHVVSDIEHISKEIILLKKGEVVGCKPAKELCRELSGKVFAIKTDENLEEIKRTFMLSRILPGESPIAVVISEKIPINYEYTEIFPMLEDVYLYYFSEESEEGI